MDKSFTQCIAVYNYVVNTRIPTSKEGLGGGICIRHRVGAACGNWKKCSGVLCD